VQTFGQDRDDDLSLHILEQPCQILDQHPAELFMPSTVTERGAVTAGRS
jgi:hypothetical protein